MMQEDRRAIMAFEGKQKREALQSYRWEFASGWILQPGFYGMCGGCQGEQCKESIVLIFNEASILGQGGEVVGYHQTSGLL